VEKKANRHNDEWALFLIDDDSEYWLEWGQKKKAEAGEDGLNTYLTDHGRTIMVAPDTDFRSEVCRNPSWRDPFGNSHEIFRVYRAHVHDLNAWSWGSMPGKRLDEAVISRLVNGNYAAQELDHLKAEDAGMDMKKIIVIGVIALAAVALAYFVVLPMFKGDKKVPVVTDNTTTQVTENVTQPAGHWVENDKHQYVWVLD
jgi:hypothetical protein